MTPETVNPLIEDLAAATEDLIQAMAAETQAIRAFETTAMTERTAEKASAAGTWEARIALVNRAAGGLATLPPEHRQRLRDLGARLAPVAEDNARTLGIAVGAGRRTMASVAEVARTLTPAPSAYGRDGTSAHQERRPAAGAVAVSFNRAI